MGIGLLAGVPLVLLLAALLTDRGRVAGINALLDIEAHLRPAHLIATTQIVDDWIPNRSVLLIGDSLIRTLPSRWVDPQAVNIGIGGATGESTVLLANRKSLRRARAVVILVGSNDVAHKTPVPCARLLAGLPPQLPALVCTIPPVDPARQPSRPLPEIAAANQRWAIAVAARPNTFLVRTEAVLAGRDGSLQPNLHLDDGLHLNAEGRHRLAALIREGLVQIPE